MTVEISEVKPKKRLFLIELDEDAAAALLRLLGEIRGDDPNVYSLYDQLDDLGIEPKGDFKVEKGGVYLNTVKPNGE